MKGVETLGQKQYLLLGNAMVAVLDGVGRCKDKEVPAPETKEQMV